MKFVNFVGNERVKEQLTYLQESGRLPHAFVIEGEEGLGKRTLAKEIVLNLFCKSDEKPCFNCPQCSKVLKGVHPDVFEYSAPGGVNSFHIQTVREIIEDVCIQPNEADYKVYILGNCQCMNMNAQNALLKVLEEPPEYVMFIMTTDSKSALLETVLSRSVVISLEGVSEKLGADYICSHIENANYDDALNACTVWGGNIGKAIETLGDSKLAKISSVANEICTALTANDEYSLLKTCAVFDKDREFTVSALTLLKTIFRDALVYSDTSVVLSGQRDSASRLAHELSKKKLVNLVSACDNLISLVKKNANNAIVITKICYDLRRAVGR